MNTLETLREYQENYLMLFNRKYKRYIHKEIDFSPKLIGIIGARGVGKTTFLLQYLRDNSLLIEKKLYFSADDLDIEIGFNNKIPLWLFGFLY